MVGVRWMDLLGNPYKLHGTGEGGYDCSSLAEEVVRRTGRDVPPTSPFRIPDSRGGEGEIESYFEAMDAAYEKVGTKVEMAKQAGDIVLSADPDGSFRGLYVLVEPNRGTFLTAHETAGVVSVRRFAIKHSVGVYRAKVSA
jgi:cell wall-associated NlpC family hydrolase